MQGGYVLAEGPKASGRSGRQAASREGGGTWPHLRQGRSICVRRSSTPPGGCAWAAGETEENQAEIIARAQCPGLGPMKRMDSGYIYRYAPPPPPPPPPCWAHHAPRQSPRQPPSRERGPPERARSWAVAAEEEEAASAAPWMRRYFGEDDGETIPRTNGAAAFLSDTKDRGPPVQSQTWRSGERIPFGQAHSLRAFEKPPLVQTQALRDFEKNIELKVEVESLKRELQDRKQHLDKTWADVEDLNSQNEAELRHQAEERQQETEHVYEFLENKIQLLQEESRLAKNEATGMAALAKVEKGCNLELSDRLKDATKGRDDMQGDQMKPDQYSEALAQRDRRIEELRQSLAAQEGLVEQLSQEKQQLLHLLEEPASMEVQPMPKEVHKQQKLDSDEAPVTQPSVSDSHLAELQDKIQQTEATNKSLQEKLNEMSCELKSAHESSQKQDTTIQSLKETLKSRESETEELYQVIEGQNDTMAKLREMLHQSQLGQLHTSEGIGPAQQQVALLDLQSALFCSQLEIQKLQRLVRQKERQLADGKRCMQFVEATAQEREQQKEAAWKHNQELRRALRHLQGELQTKNQQLHVLEAEKYSEIRAQEQTVQHLNSSLSHKEQLVQELQELLQYRDNSDKTLETNEMLLEKLRQRIQDRAVALERVIDDKFSALEEKDKELRQLHLSVRERDHDLERLRSVLSANEATMQSMESLLRAKSLEVEQLTATCQNLQWLKEESETKFGHWQKEQESIIQQLQTSLHDRNKEVEDLSATLLCKLGPGQSEIAEELCQRLQRKERMLQDLLSDRNKQAVEHEMEVQALLQSVSTREQESQAAAEKMAQALMERNSELQALRQYLGGKEVMASSQALISNQQAEVTSIGPHLGEQTDQGSLQVPSREDSTSLTAREDASVPRSTLGDLDMVSGLEKELSNAREELELMAKKERESQIELSALQSMVAVQEEELQVQAADLESLTRNMQIKEDLIKDLQMQLVDPEDIPAMERLTQEVLLLREKVASVDSQGQEVSGNRRQQLLLTLEGLVDERSRLNEALQAERQLYSSLVKFHAHPENSERDRTLQVELEGVQVLRSRLEEVLGRSLERLSRLETLAAIGGAAAGDDTEDASTEFTDSIEEEAAHSSHQQLIKVALEKSLATMETQNTCPQPPSPVGEDSNRHLQEEMLHLRAEIHQHLEEKRKAEAELKELKAQIEEAGFSSVSHIRNTMLSLCLENAELKEQMGEAMSDGWEVEEDKEKGEVMVETVVAKGALNENSLQAEFRKVQGKLKSAYNIINLLKEQLVLSSSEGNSKGTPEFLVRLAREVDRMNTGLPSLGKHQHQKQENTTTGCGPRPQSLSLGTDLSVDAHELENKSQAQDSGHQPEFSLAGSAKHLRSQLAQCRQRYQDLQEKLLISEATVFAQANQLEKYRAIFSESLVKQDSKQIQVDLQDLGYETCGRSENEAEREETTSPECEEHNNPRPSLLAEVLCSEQGYLDPVLVSPPAKPLETKLGKQEELQARGNLDDSSVLRKDIRDLKAQLQNANKVIQNLRSRVRSLSATSDYSSSLERPRKLRAVATLEASSPHSVTDEDEGWLSDGTGAFYSPGIQAKKDLESLIQRVSQLEAQLPKTGLEGKLDEELRAASWPGKYDSLIQDQARELSYLRQKIREGRGICYLLTQHAKDTVKSFEDLLRSNDIDYYLGQSFREQLAQGGQLTERLTSKLSTKDHKSEKEEAGLEPLALRLSRELQEKEKVIEVLQAKLDTRSLSPPSSHAMSDSHRSASSTSFLSDEIEACSDMDVASEYTQCEEKPSPSHSDSIHHSSHSAVLSSKPSPTSASQGLKVESSNRPISLPTPQNPPKEASQAHPGFHFHSIAKPASLSQAPMRSTPPSFLPFSPSGPPLLGGCETPVVSLAEAQQELQMLQKQLGESVSIAPPASTSTLLSNHPEASSSHYLSPAKPHSPTRGSMELGRMLEPGYLGSGGQWDMRPQKGSVSGDLSLGSSLYQLNSKPTGADLLEEHLGEIRNLRQRLEESICVNDRLREQLQHRLSSTARESGSTTHFYSQGLDSMPQLYNENRALREENQSLQAQLSLAAKGHSQETDRLREALLSSGSQLQELEKELEQQKAERQQLLEDLQGKQEEILHFREERLALQENDSRLQHKLALLQQQCEEKQQLSLSLQSELQIYESLCGNPNKCLKDFGLDSCHYVPSELSYLVAEIRALRGQLEQSIQVNNCLRLQLEQQLDCGAGKANLSSSSVSQNFSANTEPTDAQPLSQDSAASAPVRDVGLNSPAVVLPSPPGSDPAIITRTDELSLDDSPGMKNPHKLEGDATDGFFASKHGRHVIGHVDDYCALQQQVGEGKLLVQKILSLIKPTCSIPGLEARGTEAPGNKSICELRNSARALNHALEESASLLTTFWRAALPNSYDPLLVGKEDQLMEKELLDLRAQVSQQEQLLQRTASRLKRTSQQKKSMEQFIVSQLTRTHDILKKARTNLEVKSLKALLCPPAL
ncbi:myomegalin-like isoform X15 [Meriones unguiculatus]|uniref:myomegalin-like isoform X15 n=1 Tax=Meriones unguiculatus TaxID=10047 RepID=UPI00293EB24A|nr:myomegalin-like isoform X15 [Meriones unguiculatus]